MACRKFSFFKQFANGKITGTGFSDQLGKVKVKRFVEMEARILSIQSHVVSGYVGNKSAVFPMQLLGFDVDNINSVQFSNHTGYKTVKGNVITSTELGELVDGLHANAIDKYSHLLTGYVGDKGFLQKIVEVHKQLKSANPELIYVCDPVMGDNGQLYVPAELVAVYKKEILPIATILTPNLFEIQLLTDVIINDEASVWQAMNILHARGVETVCLSSAELPQCADLCVFASSIKGTKLKLTVPKLPVSFTGSGDLFAALLLCFMHLSKGDLQESLEKTVSGLQAVLQRTFEYNKEHCQGDTSARSLELRLIQSRDDLIRCDVTCKAAVVE